MGEEVLVDGLVTDAISLVRILDEAGYPPTFATWYLYEDAAEWRLLVAGPSFDKLLPKDEQHAYQAIAEAISKAKLDSLGISLVKIVKTSDPLPKTLRTLVGTAADGTTQAHFSNTTINGIFIREMVILRSA